MTGVETLLLALGVLDAPRTATVPGPPVPKARARVVLGRGRKAHAYTPARTEAAEGFLSLAIRAARRGAPTITGPVAFAAVFHVAHRRPRGDDVDNLLKLALDAATKAGVWEDDAQVVAVAARVLVDAAAPRTEMAWASIGGGDAR